MTMTMTVTTTGVATRASVRGTLAHDGARNGSRGTLAHDGARNGSRFAGDSGFASRRAREALAHERHDDTAQVEVRERREAKDERRVAWLQCEARRKEAEKRAQLLRQEAEM